MKNVLRGIVATLCFLFLAPPAFAVSSEITNYTTDTLQLITYIALSAASLFCVYAGYLYLTSAGRPDALEHAKKTLQNALIGVVLVLASRSLITIFQTALQPASESTTTSAINLAQIEAVEPSDGLTQILIDAVSGLIQNVVQSATEPIVDSILGFVSNTPSVLTNSVVSQFWLVSLGIVDSLFVIIVALIGLQVMSASIFGFEELTLKQLLPRLGLAFLGANISLFLANYVILTTNALVKAVLDSTGGLNEAWVKNTINLGTLLNGTAPLITLIFLVLFLVVAIVLLLMYISRLILISLGAVLSPFIFLLWALPKTAPFAEMAAKTYIVTVGMVFIHVVILQLAASFLTLPETSGNSLISVATAIGLVATLIKTPSLMMHLISSTANSSVVQKMGGQIMNVVSNLKSDNGANEGVGRPVKLPRKATYI